MLYLVAGVVVDELCSFSVEHAVVQEFAEVKRGGFGSNVAIVDDAAAHDGDARAFLVLLGGGELAHHLCEWLFLCGNCVGFCGNG